MRSSGGVVAHGPVLAEPTGPDAVPAAVGSTPAAVAASWPGGLLGTKIAPPTVPGGFLPRPRLHDRLDAAVTGPATVVSGGAGAGKTLVVASWARSAGAPRVAWLALDRDDNQPALFWGGVSAALRVSGAVPASGPLTGLALEHGVTAQGMRALRSGLNDLIPGAVLVLDDFQVIDHPEILESVAVLLRHESPLRLVLISRADPVLPLHRLRVSGGLHEIRGADLAFDRREADEFLRLNGHVLPGPDVRLLVERTQGWATGLRLAALFLSRDPGPGRAGMFAGDDRVVVEYLLAEVLEGQPPRTREFLLRTCIPERICGELADTLVDGHDGHDGHDGQRQLEELERANTFITAVGTHRSWYRYHPLLRETLLHELRTRDPVVHVELHRRAARWFAGHAAPVAALRHAADAQDWVLLGELFVTTAGPQILSADRQAVNETLARIPDTELTRTAALGACAAARLDDADRVAEIPTVIARAERMLAADDTSYRAATAAAIGLWETAIARRTGDMPLQLRTCQAVLTYLVEVGEPFHAADQYRAVALAEQGEALVWTGQVDAGRAVLTAALDAAAAADLDYTAVECLGALGMAAIISGRLHDAQSWAARGLDLAGLRGWTGSTNTATCYLTAALVQLLRGHPGDAEPLLRRAAAASKAPLPGIAVMIGQAMVDVALGRPQSALRSARAARDGVGRLPHPPDFVRRWVGLAEAEAHLTAGDPAAVTALAGPDPATAPWPQETVRVALALMELDDPQEADRVLRQAPTDPGNPLTAVESWLAAALIADRLRQHDRALQAMTWAVHHAAPEGLALPFLTFDPARGARLLNRVTANDPAGRLFLRILGRLGTPIGRPDTEPAPPIEPLTDREMSVLRLLPSMRSNTEIADELFISVNTVKAHLKALYRKLDVPNRRAAVDRGHTLRLIS